MATIETANACSELCTYGKCDRRSSYIAFVVSALLGQPFYGWRCKKHAAGYDSSLVQVAPSAPFKAAFKLGGVDAVRQLIRDSYFKEL